MNKRTSRKTTRRRHVSRLNFVTAAAAAAAAVAVVAVVVVTMDSCQVVYGQQQQRQQHRHRHRRDSTPNGKTNNIRNNNSNNNYKSDPLEFPIPTQNDDGYGSGSSYYISDPDHILSRSDFSQDGLAQKLHYHNDENQLFLSSSSPRPTTTIGTANSDGNDPGGSASTPPVQIAVAVIERIDPKFYMNDIDAGEEGGEFGNSLMEEEDMDAIIESAVGRYARAVHDHWGVGYTVNEDTDSDLEEDDTKKKTTGLGTGVLLFLDVYDRVVYISRGAALEQRLNDRRADSIIDSIRPHLRRAQYGQGLSRGIDLIVEYIEKGDPTWQERLSDWFRIENMFVLVWVYIVVGGIYRKVRQRRDQRLYAQAYSQLNEIDRTHAEALQGNFETTSCPICLEAFESNTIGSDGAPLKLLRCGHVFDESCWEEWVSSGNGDPTKCPVCRLDVGKRPQISLQNDGDDENIEMDDDPSQPDDSNDSSHENQQDSLTSPSAAPTDYPYAAPTAAPLSDQGTTSIFQGNSENNDSETENLVTLSTHVHHRHPHQPDGTNHERAIRQFQQERNFRLLRLAQMYPRFITSTQLNQWTSPTYHGTMTHDPSFTSHDPVQRQHRQHHQAFRTSRFGGGGGGGGFGRSTFGGGTSSGGRSGRF